MFQLYFDEMSFSGSTRFPFPRFAPSGFKSPQNSVLQLLDPSWWSLDSEPSFVTVFPGILDLVWDNTPRYLNVLQHSSGLSVCSLHTSSSCCLHHRLYADCTYPSKAFWITHPSVFSLILVPPRGATFHLWSSINQTSLLTTKTVSSFSFYLTLIGWQQ